MKASRVRIERYTDEHLRTRFHDLHSFFLATPERPIDREEYRYMQNVPEFNMVYCLTRYVSTLGDSRYLETPSDLSKWLIWGEGEGKMKLTERQRYWGGVVVNNLLFFMDLSYAEFLEGKPKADGFYTVSMVEGKADPHNQSEHKEMLWTVLKRPNLVIADTTVWTDGLLEFDYALREMRTHKRSIINRRKLIGDFNWADIKKSTPSTLNRRIDKLITKVDRVRRIFGTGDKAKENDVLCLPENQLDSLSDLLEQADKSAEDDRNVSAVRKKLAKAHTVFGDDATDKYKYAKAGASRLEVVRNPRTGMLETIPIITKPDGEESEDEQPKKPKRNKPPGECELCKAATNMWICWRCRDEEDRWNTPPDDINKSPNVNDLPNFAWLSPEYPRHGETPIRFAETLFPCLPIHGRTFNVFVGLHLAWRSPPPMADLHLRWRTPPFLVEEHFDHRPPHKIILGKPEYTIPLVKNRLIKEVRKDNRKSPLLVASEITDVYGGFYRGTTNSHIGVRYSFLAPYLPEELKGFTVKSRLPVGKDILLPYEQKHLALKLGLHEMSVKRSFTTLERALEDYFQERRWLKTGLKPHEDQWCKKWKEMYDTTSMPTSTFKPGTKPLDVPEILSSEWVLSLETWAEKKKRLLDIPADRPYSAPGHFPPLFDEKKEGQ